MTVGRCRACKDRDAPVTSLAAAFLQRTDGPVATRRGGRHGCLMPNLPGAAPGIERGGSLRSRPQALARHGCSDGHGATETQPATCGIVGMSTGREIPCPPPPMSDGHLWHGPGPGRIRVQDPFRGAARNAMLANALEGDSGRENRNAFPNTGDRDGSTDRLHGPAIGGTGTSRGRDWRRTPRPRELSFVQIVQSIIERGIE